MDHNTIDEIRLKSEEGSNLLTTSAIMAMEWTSKEFAAPVIVSNRGVHVHMHNVGIV